MRRGVFCLNQIGQEALQQKAQSADIQMKRVLTYGTFDTLHYGHIRLLQRARALGDYLIVALSTDGGATFPRRMLIEDGPGTCTSNDSTDGRNREMSYPWIWQAPDGTLHLAYTYHRRTIKYVRLSPRAQAALEEQTA